MTREEVITKYKGGISIFEGYATEEWLLDDKKTTSDELYLIGYDANLYPLPNFETWSYRGKQDTKEEIIKALKSWKGAVYLDGSRVM